MELGPAGFELLGPAGSRGCIACGANAVNSTARAGRPLVCRRAGLGTRRRLAYAAACCRVVRHISMLPGCPCAALGAGNVQDLLRELPGGRHGLSALQALLLQGAGRRGCQRAAPSLACQAPGRLMCPDPASLPVPRPSAPCLCPSQPLCAGPALPVPCRTAGRVTCRQPSTRGPPA